MNLTLHLVLNDFRRMRAWLLAWIAVLLLPLAVGYAIVTRDPSLSSEWIVPDMVTILAGLQVVVGYVFALILMHEHGIVGTNQFWLTRPISRGRLIIAKAIGLFLMVGLLPVFISALWWLWCGFNGEQIISAAGDTLLMMMLIALAAALMAVLTDSFPRALLWTVVFVAVLLFGMLYSMIVTAVTIQSAEDSALLISRSIVAVVAIAVVMLVVVVARFFVREPGWWLVAPAALAVVLLFIASRWPWGWFPSDPVESNATLADGVKLRFDRATAGPLPRERRLGEEVWQELRTHFIVSGLPKELDARSMGIQQEWRSGTIVMSRDQRDWHRGAGDQLPEGEEALRVISFVQPSIVARLQSEPPEYHARVWWQLVRWQTLFKIPLAAGGRVTREGWGIRVANVERSPSKLEVTTVETRPVTIRSLLDRAVEAAWYHRRQTEDAILFRIHRESGQHLDEFVHNVTERRVTIKGVEILLRRRGSLGMRVYRNGKWEYRRPLVDGDILGAMIWKEEAVFSREVKVQRLNITGP